MYNQLNEKDNNYPLSDWILFILYLITIFLAITTNSIILTIFIKKRKVSATYILISNNCISDILSALLMILQWYFCSKIFLSNQSNTFLLTNSNQFLNNLTKFNQPSNLSINLTTNLLLDLEKFKQTNLQLNKSKESNHNYQNQLNNSLNKIIEYQNKINEKLITNEKITYAKKLINENKINDQPSIIERLSDNINLININNDQGILNKLQNNQQTNQQIFLLKDLNDQIELDEFNLFKNQKSQQLPNNLENDKEKLRKKRFNFEEVDQSTKSVIDSILTTEATILIDNLESTNQQQTKNDSKFRNLVNQLIQTNKFIKSKFFFNETSNCGQRICGILETLQMSTYFVSTLTMAGIAYNRYNLINRPLAQKMNTSIFLIAIYIIAASMSILASLSSLRVFVFFTQTRIIDCQVILSSNDGWYIRKYRAVIVIIIQYILPLSCICFLYCKVIKELRNCGFVRTKHQSSTSSNNLSIDNYVLFNQNPKISSSTINYNNTLPKVNSNLIQDKKNIFKISLEMKSEPDINNRTKIELDTINKTKLKKQSKELSNLNFKSLNLVNLPLFKRLNNSSINDLPVYKQNYIKNKSNENQFNKIINKKIVNNKFINKQSSNESQNTLSSNQSVSAKLNLLDGELDRTKRRLTKMMILVVIVFALSWLPVHLANLKQFFIDKHDDINFCDSSFLYLLFYFFGFSTFTYNPIIYFCFSKEIQKDTLKIFKFLFKFRFLKFIRFKIRGN